jgi:purine-binding chemotaxis protein CheW
MSLESAEKMDDIMQALTNKVSKYLTFALAGEEYGIDILKVKEIIGSMPITTIPQMPDFVKGVINLRDKVIPVVDLRLKFELESIDYTNRTCIIVVEVTKADGNVLVGIVVDSVSEVLNIDAEDIEGVPIIDEAIKIKYVLGMAKIKDGVKILIDVDKILSNEELVELVKAV